MIDLREDALPLCVGLVRPVMIGSGWGYAETNCEASSAARQSGRNRALWRARDNLNKEPDQATL